MYGVQAGEGDLRFESCSKLLERNHSGSDLRMSFKDCVAELCVDVKRTRDGVVYVRLQPDEIYFVTKRIEESKVTVLSQRVCVELTPPTVSCNALCGKYQKCLYHRDCTVHKAII